jgi:thioredoxin reductase (NADPH)
MFDLDTIKRHLSYDILTRIERDEIFFLPSTIPVEITPGNVVLAPTNSRGMPKDSRTNHEADFVLLMTGFAADTSLLEKAGVKIFEETQAPVHNTKTMETNVPGIFVAGTLVSGSQWRVKHAIYNSHDHVARIVKVITGQITSRLGTVVTRNSDVSWEEVIGNQ